MKKMIIFVLVSSLVFTGLLSACQQDAPSASSSTTLKVIAVESFLADITRAVAGDRAAVDSLIPLGTDPHAFEPTPKDVVKLSESQVLVLNGGGLEAWLENVITNAGNKNMVVIEASAGLSSRKPSTGERAEDAEARHQNPEIDPHFWLNPILVIQYVENIRDGLTQADPEGKSAYAGNAENYIARLKELDQWIQQQVSIIPPERRLMVTNHESFGYFADRYGFRIIGTVVPGVSSGASPSAQQLARLVDFMKANQVKAIFLESGSNSKLADQIASETGARVVADLFTHSTTPPGGKAPSYLDMMKFNTNAIVNVLK